MADGEHTAMQAVQPPVADAQVAGAGAEPGVAELLERGEAVLLERSCAMAATAVVAARDEPMCVRVAGQ